MSNHLGNVLTVINDIKVPYLACSGILYEATIMRTYDYSPFGVQLDGRSDEREFCESSTTTALVTDLDNNFNDGTIQGWNPINGSNHVTELLNSSSRLRIRRLSGHNANQFGAYKEVALTANAEYNFSATINRNTCDGFTIRVRIIDPCGNDILNEEINPTGITNFSHTFTALHSGNYTLVFDRIDASANCVFFVDDVLLTHTAVTTTYSNCVGAETYRFGYQGSEKDDEIKGEGNSYTTEFRMLDTRLGRWLSIDPLAAEFPWQSPYISMDNNPIEHNDSDGDKPRPGNRGGVQSQKNFYRNLRTANTIARVNANTRANGQNRGAKKPPLPRPTKHFTSPTSRPEFLTLTWSGYDRNEGFSTSRGPNNPPQQRGVRQTPELLAEGVELLTALTKSGYESFTSASLTYNTKYHTKPFCKTEEINSDFQITFDSKEEAQVFNAAQAAWESVYLDNLDQAIANQESNLKNPMSAPGPSPHQIALLKTIMQVGESPLKRLENNLFEAVKTGSATHEKKTVERETVGNSN